MARTSAGRSRSLTNLEQQLHTLQLQSERNRRALEALYNISLACRGVTSFQQIFEATYRELRTVFPLDSCYIAVCDSEHEGMFRQVLLVDEDLVEYVEGTSFGALTGALISERRPRLYRDLTTERGQLNGNAITPFGNEAKLSRSWIGVPLLVRSNAVGVISLQSYQPDLYNEADLDLLQRLGNVVAVVIENAWLDQQQRALSTAMADQVTARTVELLTLSSVAAELVLQNPLPVLLERALDLVVPLFALEAGTVRLLDQRRKVLTLSAQRGFSDEYLARAVELPLEGSAVGSIARDNHPLVVEANLRQVMMPELEPYIPYSSLLGVPLRIGERVMGVLSLFGREPQQFSQQSIDLAQAIGNQMAIAIENAYLFEAQERQIRELRALGSISHAASTTLDLPTLLRKVHDELSQFVKLDAFSMVVYDPTQAVVTDGIAIDEGRTYDYWTNQPLPPDSLTAWVIRNRRPLHFTNLPEQIANYPEIRRHQVGSEKQAISWLGVPLISRDDTVIGAIFIQGYHADAFDERDEAFLVSVASQVALHVQNARLMAQRERQIRELDAIGQIGQLISASFDFEEMLTGVYQTLGEVVQPSVFYLLICEPETRKVSNAIFIEEGQRIPLDWLGQPPSSGTITSWIMDQREPLLFQDLVNQRESLIVRGIQPRAIGPDNPVRSWVGVPLLAKDSEPIGVLSLQDYQSYRYDDQTIDFLTQVASHVSLGVQKVRLFEERERQIQENARLFAAEQAARRTADTLREVARVLSGSFDPREVLALMLRELNNIIAYDTASIMLVDGDMLRVAATRGFEGVEMTREISLLKQTSAAGSIVRTREPHVIPDVTLSESWMPASSDVVIRAWLGVPLIVKGRVLGVMNIDSRQPNYFTPRDIELAQAFANQAAIALENARLYEESITRVEQELDIARRIQSNLFPQMLPQIDGLAIDARCIPAREVGGDFFDFVVLEPGKTGGSLGLFVGDASGKSVPGAMLMAIAHSIVRSEARDHQLPPLVMRETNEWITRDIPSRSFVALCYATLDFTHRRLALANAGQLTPICCRVDGRIEYLEVPGPRLPLGIISSTPYDSLEVLLDPGDLLVLFTDGIVEAKNPNHELFGFTRLEALLHEHRQDTPTEVIERVLEHVHEFTAGTPPHDDMTIVALRLD